VAGIYLAKGRKNTWYRAGSIPCIRQESIPGIGQEV